MFIIGLSHDFMFFIVFTIRVSTFYPFFSKNLICFEHDYLDINLVDLLFLSLFGAYAQFGSHEMMVLGLALRKALGDTRVSHESC
jgi:hypothetical protein